jgi:hypothetical protein
MNEIGLDEITAQGISREGSLPDRTQVALAKKWLAENFTRADRWRRSGSHGFGIGSYGLKHDCEKAVGAYVSNGALIAAALALGFPAKRQEAKSPNAFFKIKPIAALALQKNRGFDKWNTSK